MTPAQSETLAQQVTPAQHEAPGPHEMPGPDVMPTLIGCSHGTSSESGRAAIRTILDDARALLPGVRVVESFVDVQEPSIDEVVTATTGDGGTAIVVPLLLSTGYHTRVDIARAVTASGGRAVATPALGPHPLLVDVLVDRLANVAIAPEDALVLAAAGSSDPRSAEDVEITASMLRRRLGRDIRAGYAASASPTLDEAVATARARANRVVGASYVLAPGFFAGAIGRCGVDDATLPLAPDPRVARIVAERYQTARGTSHKDLPVVGKKR